MRKKLTITIDEAVYAGLNQVVGRGRISQFIESLVRPHVMRADLKNAYLEMSRDETREAEAAEWIEGTLAGDLHDPR
jgi:predicted CopG family antitoxin